MYKSALPRNAPFNLSEFIISFIVPFRKRGIGQVMLSQVVLYLIPLMILLLWVLAFRVSIGNKAISFCKSGYKA